MATTTRRKTTTARPRAGAHRGGAVVDPARRTVATLESELHAVRGELSRVDRVNGQLRGDVRYAKFLLGLAAIVLIAYLVILSQKPR